ncbi:MAG: glycoside hydrolase family 44 protein [Terracidiphilus sp.]
MDRFVRLFLASLLCVIVLSIAACGGGSPGSGGTSQNPATPAVVVTPAASNVTTAQSLGVTIAVSGSSGTPTGSVILSSGSYSSSAATLNAGSTTIAIPAGSLAVGSDTLTAKYTPDSASTAKFNSASGTATVTVTQSAKSPTVSVTPEETTHPFAENLIVTATVKDGSVSPGGSVTLSSGSFTSSALTLNAGAATFYVQPGSLAKGSDTLTVTYMPDSSNSATYAASTGTAAITITSPSTTSVTVNINALANRHLISPYIYGINTLNQSDVTNLSPTFVRFGGNEATDYNWKAFTYNAGSDWFFEDFGLTDQSTGEGIDSVQLTKFTVGAGSQMLTTMPTLGWVARESGHWSYSVKKYGAQCKVDPYNSDAGNGQQTDCKTRVTTGPVTDAYYPLVDTASDCTSGNCLYRDEWAKALASAFGSGTCSVPYSPITTCHFYDMDNEPEIWDGPHGDVHPNHPGYTELSNVFEKEGVALKAWDPSAVRFGPITCCWNYLWTAGPAGDDKSAHAGIDYAPWWLNQINWLDQINGARTLDVFDIHAYFGDNIDTTGYTNLQLRAEVNKYIRTYWDPTYSNAGYNADWITTTQPNRSVTFLIPRMKAMVNAIYPGTPLSFTEWESFFNEWEFATALSDADAYGVMGREGLSFSTRWGGPSATDSTTNQPHPNYQSFKLYTNYDGAHHGFGSLSVSDQNSVNPDLFVTYAALDVTGTTMTIMALNKDPNNTANVTFNLDGFSASTYTAYTVGSTNPGAITTVAPTAWSPTQSFAPYTITLLVVSGSQPAKPASEWYLNPDDLMIPASGTGTLKPTIVSGTAPVTLTSAVFDAFEGATACGGSLALTDATITPAKPATITVNPGSTPGFCHYTVTGNDGTSTQTEGGWIVVGQSAATLTLSGNNQSGSAGTVLSQALAVTLSSLPSNFTNTGASILFTTSGGTLSNGTTSGTSVIAQTNSSGTASVTLTLPSTKGTITVTAQDQFALGGASVTFAENAN